MKFRTIVGLLTGLIICSCAHRTTKDVLQLEKGENQHLGAKSELLIEHGGYRESGYTDSLGTNYNLRVNPITNTNDRTVPIQVQIAFSKEYDYPKTYGDEQFNIFPLPKGWAADRTTDSQFESLFDELPNYIDKPLLNETLEPGEKLVLAIGTLYPKPGEIWSVVPNELFVHSNGGVFPTCDWLMKEDPSSSPEIALGLKLNFVGGCTIIPCGQISYPES